MKRLDEIVERYHYNTSNANMFAHKVIHPKDENQLVRDVHWLIKTLENLIKLRIF